VSASYQPANWSQKTATLRLLTTLEATTNASAVWIDVGVILPPAQEVAVWR